MEIREVVDEDAQDIYDLYYEVMNYNYPILRLMNFV